jgi:hypothetical protein
MLKRVAEIDWTKIKDSTFITLTYPDECLDRPYKERTRNRSVIIRWLEHEVGSPVPLVWRCEWKPRLSGNRVGEVHPHFHLLTLGIEYWGEHRLRERWKKEIKSESWVSVNVQSVDKGNVAALYVAKYCGKVDPAHHLDNVPYLNKVGRGSGWCRTNWIPWAEQKNVAITTHALLDAIMAIGADLLPWVESDDAYGFTVFGVDSQEFLRRLQAIGVDVLHPCSLESSLS